MKTEIVDRGASLIVKTESVPEAAEPAALTEVTEGIEGEAGEQNIVQAESLTGEAEEGAVEGVEVAGVAEGKEGEASKEEEEAELRAKLNELLEVFESSSGAIYDFTNFTTTELQSLEYELHFEMIKEFKIA